MAPIATCEPSRAGDVEALQRDLAIGLAMACSNENVIVGSFA
ncbi:hypothetical protein [Novosphingobium album (ex Liu et al. 2023)]|uniref:Uncharacterized protein n=1 Tax=Novosphingobium album (ex Liu et al. 2023) TaxID=3031130 RepID=A0ABT5WWJ3_9SPHN|nr:hypothetical protein [Novosphingobium album (ex Liu et al. 2023)]MDE8654279.1 hypothetical protein [Novosphingobium album (ex Liu et al. 2023)]